MTDPFYLISFCVLVYFYSHHLIYKYPNAYMTMSCFNHYSDHFFLIIFPFSKYQIFITSPFLYSLALVGPTGPVVEFRSYRP